MPMQEDRTSKEQFGEAELGEAQSEDPPADREMVEPDGSGRGVEASDDREATEDVAGIPPRRDLEAEEQAELAARDAARIGGDTGAEEVPPEQRAPSEAGGGEAEGFELAEEQLEESASHGDTAGDPLADRFPAEATDPEAHTIHGEPDQVDSTATGDETQGTDEA
jgi:hypothetical protein